MIVVIAGRIVKSRNHEYIAWRRMAYFFFPLHGLKLTDELFNFVSWPFCDVVILPASRVQAPPDIDTAPGIFEVSYFGSVHGAMLPSRSIMSFDGVSAMSFVVIQRKKVNLLDDVAASVLFRAREISALVTLILFAENGFSSGLAGEIHFSNPFMWLLEDTGNNTFIPYLEPDIRPGCLTVSSHQFLRLITTGRLWAISVMFNPRSKVTAKREYRDAIRRASMRLAEAIRYRDPSRRLVNSITAIEIILGEETATTFKLLAQRLNTLVGHVIADTCDIDEVLRQRHKYVHDGEEVNPANANNAVLLALNCLNNASRAGHIFCNRADLHKHLDLVVAARDQQTRGFAQVLRLIPDQILWRTVARM